MREFAGKTAVVTGAASGIGLGLAERFVRAGMQVVLADIEENALKKAVASLEQQGGKVVGAVVDTMQRESVEKLAERAVSEFGKVHVLVNNAGVASRGEAKPVWEVADPDWTWVMGVNLWGVLYGLQAFVPGMLEHGEEGHIVNTASLAAFLPGGSPYSVSKHGVLALSEGLYRNLKDQGAKIGASVLCPGFVATNIMDAERNRPKDLDTDAPPPEEGMAAAAQAMLAQGMTPAAVADIVFEAIEEERFYILPHPAWDATLRGWFDNVLARGVPAMPDIEDMMRRRAAGEQF